MTNKFIGHSQGGAALSMRILVFSDSHGRRGVIENAVAEHPEAQIVIHLGDGEEDTDPIKDLFPEKTFLGVRGNNDWGSLLPYTDILRAGSPEVKTIYYTHGHALGVNYSLEPLIAAAKAAGTDILLYGHTHAPYVEYRDGLHIMNPGSAGRSRSGPNCFGMIDITRAGIVCNIVRSNDK